MTEYFVSLGIIIFGSIWMVAAKNAGPELFFTIGILTTTVGLISLVTGYRHRSYWQEAKKEPEIR